MGTPWCAFLARELRRGHFPLWNPYCMCGMPFAANMNSGCFYPVNWLVAILPEATAINAILILHLFLIGWFASIWCRGRGVSVVSAIGAGLLFLFSGGLFLRLGAGHGSILAVMPWTILLLLSVDKIFDTGKPRWVLAGSAAVGLALLTGFVQLIYYTGLVIVAYSALRAVAAGWRWRGREATEKAPSAQDGRIPLKTTDSDKAGAAPDTGGPMAVGVIATGVDATGSHSSRRRVTPPLAEVASEAADAGGEPEESPLLLSPRQILLRLSLVVVMYFFGAALGAVQLLPGYSIAPETMRGGKLDYQTASTMNLPPANLITMIAPDFWGAPPFRDSRDVAYFGKWYAWECVPFVGVGTLALASYGALFGQRRRRRFAVTISIALLVLAMGGDTPIHNFLYNHLPMYGSFRAVARFDLLLTLYLAFLAGLGLDALLKRGTAPTGFAVGLACVGVLLFAGHAGLNHELDQPGAGEWGRIIHWLAESDAVLSTPGQAIEKTDFIIRSGAAACQTLLLPAALFLVAAMCLLLMRTYPQFAYGLLAMGLIEIGFYDWSNFPTTDLVPKPTPSWQAMIDSIAPDERVISTQFATANFGMYYQYNDAFGYDPAGLERYAVFLALAQASQCPAFWPSVKDKIHVLPKILTAFQRTPDGAIHPRIALGANELQLMRVTHLLEANLDYQGPTSFDISLQPLRRLELVTDAAVLPTRELEFRTLASPTFDPRAQVLLETSPYPQPDPSVPSGTATALDISSDEVEITADVPAPQILLMTDAYAADWHAHAMDPEPPQKHYDVLPGDYAFRAIPLERGHHHFMLDYDPPAATWGARLTLAALLAWGLAAAWHLSQTVTWGLDDEVSRAKRAARAAAREQAKAQAARADEDEEPDDALTNDAESVAPRPLVSPAPLNSSYALVSPDRMAAPATGIKTVTLSALGGMPATIVPSSADSPAERSSEDGAFTQAAEPTLPAASGAKSASDQTMDQITDQTTNQTTAGMTKASPAPESAPTAEAPKGGRYIPVPRYQGLAGGRPKPRRNPPAPDRDA